jgi:NAD(P)-dependent dehydrogenase (short-subunit alcohol dehydrogenase family)
VGSHLFDVENKVAVITGGAGGIGRALIEAFHEAGARVVGVDLAKPNEVPPGAESFESCDVRDASDVNRLRDRVVATFGSVDILVNAAGIAKGARAAELDPTDWDEIMAVNARGTLLSCQAFGRVMLDQSRGKIVNFASRCAYIGCEGYASYNASKAAVIAITKTLAVEWAPKRVTVNAVAPGFVRTPMTAYVWSDRESLERTQAAIPLGRVADPDDLAGAVLFLSSPASDYVTGTVLPVDGGMLAS